MMDLKLKEGVYLVNANDWSGPVLSVVPAPLILEVRDSSGRRVPLIDVEITVPQTDGQTTLPETYRSLYVCAVTQSTCVQLPNGSDPQISQIDHVKTDSVGRIYLTVQLGTIAGIAKLVFTVPSLNVKSYIQYVVEPGPMARIVPSVRDTTIHVGESYPFVARTADRFGNLRDESALVSTNSPAVAYVTEKTIHGLSAGRAQLLLWNDDVFDTAYVTVTPAVPLP